MREIGDQPRGAKIADTDDDDGNGFGRLLRRLAGRRAIHRNDVNGHLGQFTRCAGQPIGHSVRPAIFERDVLALGIVQFVQLLAKCAPVGTIVDDADARDLCRADTPKRACGRKGRRSANESYDLPAVHHSRPERRTRLAHSATAAPSTASCPQAGTPGGALSRWDISTTRARAASASTSASALALFALSRLAS